MTNRSEGTSLSALVEEFITVGHRTGAPPRGDERGQPLPNDFLTIFPNRLEPQSFFQGVGG